MSWLFSLLTSLPGFLNGLLAYLNKRQDTTVAQSANAKDVGISVVQAEVSRVQAAASVLQVAMGHPVFWMAWGLGVLPVLTYHAAIFFVSTFPVLGWTVLKVPDVELEYARLVVGSVFTLTGTSTVVAGIASAWIKRA